MDTDDTDHLLKSRSFFFFFRKKVETILFFTHFALNYPELFRIQENYFQLSYLQ